MTGWRRIAWTVAATTFCGTGNAVWAQQAPSAPVFKSKKSTDDPKYRNWSPPSQAEGESAIQQTSMTTPIPDGYARRPVAEIVARVDNDVILYQEILKPVKARLEMARKSVPPAEYSRLEWETLRDVTNARIERMLVIAELKGRLPAPEAMDRIKQSIYKEFEKYLMKMTREFGLTTRAELVNRLEQEGSKLEDLRNEYVDNMLAQQFLGSLVFPYVREPTRLEILRYYEENIDQYRQTPGVVWRHIEIKKIKDPKAREKANEIHTQLTSGADFEQLAKSFSHGPTAVTGGLWSKTSPGSFSEVAVDEALFKLQQGGISPVIETKSSFHIVRVEEVFDGSPVPFPEVQDSIRNRLKHEFMVALRKEKLDEFKGRHHVETIFEQPPVTAGRQDQFPR